MNCDDARFYVGLPDSDPRAMEMRAHIRACAKCRAEVDHQNNIRATFGLLRYEQPPVDFSAQCVTRIMHAVRDKPAATPTSAWWGAWCEHAAMVFQPLRLAAAAALVLGLGIYFLRAPNDGTIAGPASAQVVIHSEPPTLAPTAVPVPLAPVMLASSNSGPLRMDYGPGGAVPVKFEY